MRLAIVGNCQVDPLRHVLLMANPELSVSCFNINHTRDRHEQEKIASDLSGFDVVISQVLHENFGDLSSIEMKKKSSNFLSIPNIFFLGWHPDMTYLGGDKGRVIGPTGEVHSVICAVMAETFLSRREEVLDVSTLVKQFDTLFDCFVKSHDSFNASKTSLRKRFEQSDLSFLDFENAVEFSEPFMLTHNHPTNRALVVLSTMILEKLQLASRLRTQLMIEYAPNPLTNQVMWSPIQKEYENWQSRIGQRIYYAGKGVFVRHSDFVLKEIETLTRIPSGVPPIRRPDISKELLANLSSVHQSLLRH